eukprot:CAMPEP_0171203788 /NCGR_PEP_ID=MMETSP0790-20130122/25704_1 /TAXON_ID=2925 /ORGANISM="Alexandrium catenella, Strain OF101" /LENGTH=69 /DNA_ID=CAMNT_0011669265 /DNA_START=50 /DNA_END=256 /DNA_ORIENTATION=+
MSRAAQSSCLNANQAEQRKQATQAGTHKCVGKLRATRPRPTAPSHGQARGRVQNGSEEPPPSSRGAAER